MRKNIEKIFFVFLLIFIILFVYLLFHFRLNIQQRATQNGYETLTDFQTRTVESKEAPLGIEQEYCFVPDKIEDAYRTLMFYTIHQNVRVYVGEECVYRMEPDSAFSFGRTPGSVWNEVTLPDSCRGKTVRMVIIPVYDNVADVVPVTYFGCKYDIVADVIRDNLLSLLLSGGAILTGLIFVLFVVYNYKNTEIDKGVMMLGLFAIQIGLWKLTDSIAVNLIFGNCPALSMVPFMALMLIIIPITSFLRELHSTRDSWIWNIPCIASIIDMTLVLILQLLNLVDMRQLLLLTHVVMMLVVVVTIGMVIREILTVGWNRKLKRNIICMGLCFLGTVLDLGEYYAVHGQRVTTLGMVGFMIYIVVLGIASMREAKQLMNIGMRARKYEEMAYHDQLTGLFNRTAFAEHTKEEDFTPEHCIVVMCDLNDLKKCNDTLGHEKGDQYIKECAQIIFDCFGDNGKCYRMGGDEFCILLTGCTLEECRKKTEKMKERVKKYNQQHEDICMGIACGFELYDKRLDFDIGDTTRRADRMMYHEKFSMKQKVR